ncbi:energy-coupling factor ABC transporter ATP-binding protein [Bacillus sp. JJ1562]|uniref:energy-coupling factor ABC transporter ATP-binding protein n=1 Tax=Bacillus sp. JJ1562 TaxID=3122960 RepID=UPI0030013D83
MAIELKNVSFAYPNGHLANQDLNLTINDGECVAIIGQNGAGKTTAVKLMNALYKPTKGDVFVNGINTKSKTTAKIAKYVGYVFQNPDEQIFNKDIITELEYMPRYLKLDESEIRRRVDKAIELTQIEEYVNSNPYDIPYPIRKFVTIASVIATEPNYIILDEPTAGQDERGMQILKNIIAKLESEGTSVITITHDMEFVANNFTRVIAMANKQIIADDTPKNIFWNESVVKESRIKKPQMGEVAKQLNLPGKILHINELVDAIK